MSLSLPLSPSLAEYEAFRVASPLWLPAMRGIAAAHQLASSEVRPAAGGSNLIAFAGDDHVIKLFPPILRHQYESERLGLRALRRKLSIPTPEIVAEGALDAWPYVVMTRIAGTPLGAIWDMCAVPALPVYRYPPFL